METVDRQRETCDSQRPSTVVGKALAQSPIHRDILDRAFSYFQNQLCPTQEIEQYCQYNNIDVTYLGQTSGQFYKTVSRRDHKSFEILKKIGIIDRETERDKYSDHLVIPVLDGAEIIGLKFIDMEQVRGEVFARSSSEPIVSCLTPTSFQVIISTRTYIIQDLIIAPHSLKAIVKMVSGQHKHVDVINFYVAGNRKRLISDICEAFHFPYKDIVADISKLLAICEDHQANMEQTARSSKTLSSTACELLDHLTSSQLNMFTTSHIQSAFLNWDHMKIRRAIKELVDSAVLTEHTESRPYSYELTPNNRSVVTSNLKHTKDL